MKNAGIILAGGSGSRFDSTLSAKKQFIEFDGEPLFYKSLRCFDASKQFDEIIICAGAYTGLLVPSLNIYPIKGYSITYHHETDAPITSVLDDDAKIVASPFSNNTFRVAGTAELAGWNHEVRKDRIEPLRKWVRNNTFVKDERPEEWACLRPMTPSMVPKVGSGKLPGVFYNTGHGHLGWTLSAETAEILAKKILNET